MGFIDHSFVSIDIWFELIQYVDSNCIYTVFPIYGLPDSVHICAFQHHYALFISYLRYLYYDEIVLIMLMLLNVAVGWPIIHVSGSELWSIWCGRKGTSL